MNWQHETYWLHYLCAMGDIDILEEEFHRLAGGDNEIEHYDIEHKLNDASIRDFNYGGCLHTAVAWNDCSDFAHLLVNWGADIGLHNMQGDVPGDSIQDTLYVNPFAHIIGDGEFIPVHRFRRSEDDFGDVLHYLDEAAEYDDMPDLVIELDDDDEGGSQSDWAEEDDEDDEGVEEDDEGVEEDDEDDEGVEEDDEDDEGVEEEEEEAIVVALAGLHLDFGEDDDERVEEEAIVVPGVRRRLDFGEDDDDDERIEQMNNPEAPGELVIHFNEEERRRVGWVSGAAVWRGRDNAEEQEQAQWAVRCGRELTEEEADRRGDNDYVPPELTEEEADRRGDNDYIPPGNWPADRLYSEEEERESNGSPLRFDGDRLPPRPAGPDEDTIEVERPGVRRRLNFTPEDRAMFVWGPRLGWERERNNSERSDGGDSDREEIHYIPDPDEGMVEAADYVPMASRGGGGNREQVRETVPDTNDVFNDVSDSNDALDIDDAREQEVPDVDEVSDTSTDTGDELIENALDRYHVLTTYIIDTIRNLLY